MYMYIYIYVLNEKRRKHDSEIIPVGKLLFFLYLHLKLNNDLYRSSTNYLKNDTITDVFRLFRL